MVLLVALLVAAIAAGVSIAAVQRTARETNTTRLSQQADLVAVQLAAADAAGRAQLLTVLAQQGIEVVLVDGDAISSDDAAAENVVRQAGLVDGTVTLPLSRMVSTDGGRWLVEARRIGSGAGFFALVGRADEGAVSSRLLLRRIVIAMLIGLAAAVPASMILARLVTGPLRRTGQVADAMGAGRRDLRAPLDGPVEVRAVAESVNRLADDLAVSEDRQRRFIASVSHELRTPLAAVAGLGNALADGMVPPAETRQVARTILAETDRLERLVGDLLDLARIGAPDFRLDISAVAPDRLLAEVDAAWRPRCRGAGIELRVEVEPELPAIAVDGRRLRQVLDGLLGNAIRHLVAGAPLVVAATRGPLGVAIEIRDGGPGLTPQDYVEMFVPGVLHERYRQRRPGGGAGLGLALAHGLVTRMGGTLTAGPAPEGGVCCRITVPVAGAASS